MAYTKTNWTEATGITAARLNNLETQYEKAMADMENVVGTYVGAGSDKTITLGFRPKLLLLGVANAGSGITEIALLAFDGAPMHIVFEWEQIVLSERVAFLANGFEIHYNFAQQGVTYKYIAFK